MLLYVYRLSPASTSVQMSCSVSRSDIIVKSWEFRRNHKPPCSVYIRCRGVNGYGYSKELLEQEVKPLVEHFLRERGLELSPEKTHITQIEDGFDFLGQNVRDYKGTILVKPSRKNVASFLTKVRGIIKASRQATTGQLIVQLNPV